MNLASKCRRVALVASVVVSTSARAGSVMVDAARRGDRAALAREVATRSDLGKLSLGQAADAARAVVRREIATAAGPADAIARIDDVRGAPSWSTTSSPIA